MALQASDIDGRRHEARRNMARRYALSAHKYGTKHVQDTTTMVVSDMS